MVGHIYIALIVSGGAVIVRQPVADDLTDGRYFGIENQWSGIGREKKVSIGMHATLESEGRAGEVAQIAIGKNAKLKNRNKRDFHSARHIYRSPARPGGTDFQSQRNYFCGQAGAGSGTDDARSAGRITVRIRRPGDAFLVIHRADHGVARRVIGQVRELCRCGGLRLLIERGQICGKQLHPGLGAIICPVGLQIIAANLASTMDHK